MGFQCMLYIFYFVVGGWGGGGRDNDQAIID